MPEQTLALVAALLRRGRELDRLSAALTLLAIGLGLYQAVQGIGWRYFAAAMLAIALLGLWQKYWALRVALTPNCSNVSAASATGWKRRPKT